MHQDEPLDVGRIYGKNGSSFLRVVRGDVYDPRWSQMDFDAVIISATIDPIVIRLERNSYKIFIQANNLLYTLLEKIQSNPAMRERIARELFIEMSKPSHRKLFEILFPEFFGAQRSGEDRAKYKDNIHPYLLRIPHESTFWNTTRIDVLVVVPIFRPVEHGVRSCITKAQELHRGLKRNVTTAIIRAFDALSGEKNYRTVAIPALAGSCCRVDSGCYLSYRESFRSILRGIYNSNIPNNIDTIYLVVYKDLRGLESETARKELFDVLYGLKLRKLFICANSIREGDLTPFIGRQGIGSPAPCSTETRDEPTFAAFWLVAWFLPSLLAALLSHRQATRLLFSKPSVKFEWFDRVARLIFVILFTTIFVVPASAAASSLSMGAVYIVQLSLGIFICIFIAWYNNRL